MPPRLGQQIGFFSRRSLEILEQPTENVGKPVEHVRLIFALIIMASFLDIIDFSIVQVALPTIRTQFLATLADSQWIVGAYGLTLAGFLMLMGRAGDVYGQKKIFIAGIVLFTIASFAGGLAPSLLVLIVFRALQGIGAAMSTVTAFAIFIRIFPEGPQRNRALGVLVAVLSAGFAAGAVAGGALTVGLGWRSVMFVNVPIGIAAALLSQKYLPKTEGWLKSQRLDIPGAVTVTLGTILLVFGLTNASTLGFDALDTIVPLGLSALTLLSFLVIESRSKSPLIPMEFLKRRSVLNANTLALVLTSTVGGVSFIITIYLQNVLGYSPLYAGLGTLPGAVIFFLVGGWGAARIMSRLGARRTLLLSTALATAGIGLLTPISAQGSYFVILPGMIVWTLGASIGFPAVNLAAVAGTKPGEEGLASGVISTSFRIGFPLGLAVLLTIAGAFDPPAAASVGSYAALEGVVTGFRYALFAAVLLSLLGLALASRIKDVKPPWQK
ncbi:MFS transporter [Candidatus Bathyarchaeota archaeon]|nr:MAG: MFS transporter [Candidatus Bathyarchaeota archaeon]